MKEQAVNILGFLGHAVSVAATQVCLRRMKTAQDSTEMNKDSWLLHAQIRLGPVSPAGGDLLPLQLYCSVQGL